MTIFTDSRGRPIPKPRRSDFDSDVAYLRAFHSWKDRLARESANSFGPAFRKALGKPSERTLRLQHDWNTLDNLYRISAPRDKPAVLEARLAVGKKLLSSEKQDDRRNPNMKKRTKKTHKKHAKKTSKKGHIPLSVLKRRHARLGAIIAKRSK